MSDTTVSAPPLDPPRAPKPFGLGATLAWSALALLVMLGGFYQVVAGLLALPQPTIDLPLSLFVWDALKLAALGVIVFAIRSAGWRVRDYVGLVRVDKKTRKTISRICNLAIAIQVAVGIASLWLYGVLPASGSTSRVQAISGSDWGWLVLSFVIGSIVIVPVADEIVFRGFLYRGLAESRLGAAGAIIITALAFGLSYKVAGAGWEWVLAKTMVGLVFGWLRWRTGNVTAPIYAHAVMNFTIALMILVIIGGSLYSEQ